MHKYLVLVFLVLFSSTTLAATIDVYSENKTVELGSIFEIRISADINTPILGWGLDLNFDDQILNLVNVSTGSLWTAGSSLDGDGLAGLAFPTPIAGHNVLLSTLTFEAITEGTSILALGVTPTDFTEGFPLLPAGFADFNLSSGSIQVAPVPLPAAAWLLFSSLIGLAAFTRRG